jgi:dienelactone hydrolase
METFSGFLANFIAFAPDGLTSVGGYPGDEEKATRTLAESAGRLHRQTRRGWLLLGWRHFHNDTTPRYDEAAARLAWQRTLDFFDKYLSG